jgi:hypothetical protein
MAIGADALTTELVFDPPRKGRMSRALALDRAARLPAGARLAGTADPDLLLGAVDTLKNPLHLGKLHLEVLPVQPRQEFLVCHFRPP